MMKFFTILSFLVILCFSGQAFAQEALAQPCNKRSIMVEQLESAKYQEVIRVIGIVDENKIFEIWSNEETGSWTGMITTANGISCVVLAGNDSMIVSKKKIERPGINH